MIIAQFFAQCDRCQETYPDPSYKSRAECLVAIKASGWIIAGGKHVCWVCHMKRLSERAPGSV